MQKKRELEVLIHKNVLARKKARTGLSKAASWQAGQQSMASSQAEKISEDHTRQDREAWDPYWMECLDILQEEEACSIMGHMHESGVPASM